ncbi:putative tRNA-specific adenosine deaminase [Aspergillus nomiae NRRL 13137]|uniref:Putative tRNA-specific adenosine deaminase n=1 Tax=Aspergillus nomiae NRRL (strain ATCC 15546 / NRRL 13137 / CBS 260.88 / M93) TaxID=1509407 RepID=A0A0L1J5B7_ASPN3|nr:putative tRNA-specific adenosine deaminase [Aspergillus nomiae NRRL 13137]KNG86618.1 putative tRNA-specific adenosine deaminase [Aspergillus nomiae NRRL 13137]
MEESGTKPPLACRIARLVHAHFDGLPARSKPSIRPDGTREWIPMSGIVIVKGEDTPDEELTCVAVTSGAKCLSASQVPQSKGLVLHDWHAEILALRAFNHWLLSECRSLIAQERASSENDIATEKKEDEKEKEKKPCSPYIRRRQDSAVTLPPFELNPDLKIYMYCTCAPCGDASMELCMAAQEDPTPWEVPTTTPDGEDGELLDGRAHFSRLGIVRRKPSRADAEATRSKSCSDKLALRQVSSLLSFESSLLVATTANAYLEGIIMPEGEISRVGCERCFGEDGRMGELKGRFWSPGAEEAVDERRYGWRFRPFRILSVPAGLVEELWAFGKSDPTAASRKSKPAVISAVWAAASSVSVPSVVDNGAKSLPKLGGSRTGLYETIINGVKQGNRASEPLARGASALSRARLWGLSKEIVQSCVEDQDQESGIEIGVEEGLLSLGLDVTKRITEAPTYREFKKEPTVLTESLQARKSALRDARRVLGGWIPNPGDENWGLEVLIDPRKRKR